MLMNHRNKNATGISMSVNLRSMSVIALLCLLSTVLPVFAANDAETAIPGFPDYYKETVPDMQVKVLGGYAGVIRTWYRSRWHFNRAFEPLQITYDTSTGDVQEIEHNGSRYERADSSGTIFTYGNRRRIRVTTEGFRLEDLDGNWLEFNSDGIVTVYGDRNNVKTSYGYDASNRRTAVFDHHGTQVLWFTYDANGNLVSARDYTNREVTYDYNASNQLVTVHDLRGNLWTYTYSGTGDATRLTQITSPNGKITRIGYGNTGMLKSVLDQDNVGVTYQYLNDKAKRQVNLVRHFTGGRVDSLWYNNKSEIVRYDVNDQTVVSIQAGGREKAITDRNGATTINWYDEFENLISRVYPDGSSKSFAFSTLSMDVGSTPALQHAIPTMQLTRYTDENGAVTRYEYDLRGNLVRTTQSQGTVDERIVEYARDAHGQATTIRFVADADTQLSEINFVYDNYGNVTRATFPEGEVDEFTWNVAGKMLTQTDGLDKVWQHTYDDAENLLTTSDPLGNTETYTYDAVDNVASYTDQTNHTWQYQYDIRGNLTQVTDPLDGVSRNQYNKLNKLVSSTDESGSMVTYQYDAAGRLIQTSDELNNQQVISYNDSGEQGSGLREQAAQVITPAYSKSFIYDRRNRPIQETLVFDEGQSLTRRFAYDAVGNVVSEELAGETFAASYDARGIAPPLPMPWGRIYSSPITI